MIKLFILLFCLSSFAIFAQSLDPVLTVPKDTAQFGRVQPKGRLVVDKSTNTLYILTAEASATDSLGSASKTITGGGGITDTTSLSHRIDVNSTGVSDISTRVENDSLKLNWVDDRYKNDSIRTNTRVSDLSTRVVNDSIRLNAIDTGKVSTLGDVIYGNIGIGVTPTSKLTIKATTGSESVFELISATAGGGSAIKFSDGGTPTKYNWRIGAQLNVDNGLEITPSTIQSILL